MTQWPKYGRIEGAIVMIGFGSIGRGTLPLIERHFDFDKSHFVVIGPDDSDRALLDERGIKFVHLAVTRENYREVLGAYLKPATARASASISRSTPPRSTSCNIAARSARSTSTPSSSRGPASISTSRKGNEARTNYALRETVLAERRANPGGDDRRLVLRRQSRHGELVRQTGAGQPRRRSRRHRAGAGEPRAMGPAGAAARRQGRPYRRARHAARQAAEAARQCSSTPGRSKGFSPRACSRPNSAGARTSDGRRQRRLPQGRLRRGDLSAAARRQHPRALVDADARRRNSASSSPTTSRSRSPIISRCATTRARRSIARPATTPITPATTRC